MTAVIILSLITIVSVVLALRRKKVVFMFVPLLSLFGFAFVKVLMVPMPFWDTVRFIFNLQG
ncbi:hypothetical protein MUO14_05730 [Halobacillus shinanisalinarum]|uniref:Tripartite tricarboxylate transporter TctB family protein n=1 Tax=Halobacillus shinanisalinarum TaxID=2932258 RepID=A0ABY4H2W7_9BACI|nr:hypothetical protein [Halobacillus shinanisalinarum]UOQ94454.1 hypothetical protein MUO14_05730 [Halobacillus shinanisalinarum]